MIKLKFNLDKYHLAYRLWMVNVLHVKKIKADWKALHKEIRDKYESYPGYCFFETKYMGYGMVWANYDKSPNVIRDEVIIKRIFGDIFNSKLFKKKYSEAQEYKKMVETQWRKNKEWLKEFEKITGLSTNETLEVLIMHPEMEAGAYLDSKQIEMGCPEYYENYNFIGLCHEVLHYLTEKQYLKNKTEDEQWLLHALICLSTDEELRKRMTGSNHYLQPRAPYFQSKLLTKMVKKVLPGWKKYILEDEKSNIIQLFGRIK